MKFASKALATTAMAAILALGYAGVSAVSASSASAGDATVATPIKADDFRLTDQNLLSHQLRRLSDAGAVVLITQKDGAPVNRDAAGTVKALQARFAAKGVEFFMLNSNLNDTREAIQAEAAQYGYDLPVLLDRNQLVGEQLGVTRAGEAIVIDPKTWKIVYRGPVSSTQNAVTALLAGQPVAVAQDPVSGSPIDFPNRNRAAEAQISYVHDVAPIVEAKCAECHEKGGIGPMPLTSYEDIKRASPMIREVLRTQRMPPWRADPTVGHFKDDKSLSGDQIKTLVHWVEAGAPRGEGADPFVGKTFVAKEWPLGKPDAILDLPAYDVPATGVVDYQHPWVANPLTEGKWLRASTIKVENRQVVHHILTGYMADVPKPGEEANENKWGSGVGGYAVGAESMIEPHDTGSYLPAGGAIGFQNHYTPFGKAVTEHSKIALYFYKDKPTLIMHGIAIANPNITIPPNQEAWRQQAYVTFPKDALLYGAFPHAHYRGASSQLWLQTPDGKKTLLLALPNYDFNWQRFYDFAQPIKAPAGSKLIAIYTYDNSARNPANPDHNRMVPWGEQSYDEMLYTAVRYRWEGETSDKPNHEDAALRSTQLFGMLDARVDGKISPDELTGPIGGKIKQNFAMIDANHDGFIEPEELAAAQKFMDRRRQQAEATPKVGLTATEAAAIK